LIDTRRYLSVLLLVPLLVAIRGNSVIFPIILVAYLRRASVARLLWLSAIPIAVAFVILRGYFDRLLEVIQRPVGPCALSIAQYFLVPLPTNILDYDTEQVFIYPWYVLSFVGIVAGFFAREFYASIARNWLWIGLLTCAALGPYLPYVNDVDIVGPRQFSSIG